MRSFCGILGLLFITTSALCATPPNILIITVDNLGYGDLQMYNPQSEIKTPRLDRFAKQSVRLTSFYTASPTCTVSRACLLTGRLPQRHGLTRQLPGVEGNYGVGLSQGEIIIPKVLKQAPTPYITGCFGKWNIGFAAGSRPTERGFDEFIGHASGNMDYYYHNYREKHDLYQGTQELHREGEYATDIFAEAAIDFIQRQSRTKQPWFCYLPFNAPHFPTAGNKIRGEPNIWQAPDWAFDSYEWGPEETNPRKRYAAVVTALDRRIGDVLDALDQLQIKDNTFVFFMSDNGAFRLNRDGLDVGINTPLRSGGVTCWEGGLRVPALASFPGKIQPGSVLNEPLWSPDLFVTACKLAGASPPSDREYDGHNLIPVITKSGVNQHHAFFFEYGNHTALRRHQWKIVREKPNQPWSLFDLSQDVSESHNLADEKPMIVQKLASEFLWRKNKFAEEQ